MKKTINTKILVLAISLALLICGIVGVAVSAESDASASGDASLAIYKKNVSFQNAPQLVFAVAYENVDPTAVTLDVWYGEKSGEATNVTSFGNVTVDGNTYLGFAVEPADPKDIDKLVYVQAKSGETVSEVERYSILEYAWAGVMTSSSDESAADYYNIIEYSKSVQKWLTASGKFNGTPVDSYFYVKAEGVALDESGYDSGVFTSPVTFTLGASALGWNVTTYANGTKTNEVKAAGDEITASASTICTPVEKIAPQQVAGTPLDFENLTIGSKANGGADTTFLVGSSLNTANSGTVATKDKDGNDTTAYYFDSESGTGDTMRLQSYGDDVDTKVDKSSNAFIFETDIRLDYADGTTYSKSAVQLQIGNSNTTSLYAYLLIFYLDDTTKTVKMVDSGASGLGAWVITDVKSGEWFNLRVEYYKVSADEMLTLVFINGELTYVSNNFRAANAKGDDAWPVYSDSFTASNGTAYKGVSAVYLGANKDTDASIYLDNTLIRRTVLTPPTIPVSEYDSYYTPAN